MRMITMNTEQEGDEESCTSIGDVTKTAPRMTSVDDSVMLPEYYKPNDADVICSWARQNHSHPGNERFRLLVENHAPIYLQVKTKYQKSEVIAKIVEEVRKNSPGGGFVKKDFYSGRWFEIGDEKARDKVGHAIRKAAAELGKKQSGGVASKKIAQSAQQKGKRDKKRLGKLGGGADVTESLVGSAPAFWNNPLPSLNLDMARFNSAAFGPGNADLRADRATSFFLTPSVDSTFHPTASVFAGSNLSTLPMLPYGRDFGHLGSFASGSLIGSATGLDGSSSRDTAFVQQSMQRQRLLMNAAQKQQEALNLLLQSNAMNFLAQTPGASQLSPATLSALNDMNSQRQIAAAAATLFGRANMGLPTTRHGMEASFASGSIPSEYGSLFPSSVAAAAGTRITEQQKRAATEILLSRSSVPSGTSGSAGQGPSPWTEKRPSDS